MPGMGNHAGGSSTACSRMMAFLFMLQFLSDFFEPFAAAFSAPPIATTGRSSSHQQSFSLAYTNLPGEHGDGNDGNLTIDESVLQQMRNELDGVPNADLLTTSEAEKYYHLYQQDDDGVTSLIQELNETMKENLPKAIEPSKEKPSKPYKSPIQVYQLVPRVQPIQKASVFFLSVKPTKAKDADSKPKLDWKTANKDHKTTAFQATNYLDSLDTTKSSRPEDGDVSNDDLEDFKQQQAQLRNEKRKLQAQAFYDANKRTNPNEAIKNRIEKSNKERAEKERSALERSFAERKKRLDKQLYMDELKRQEQGAERDPQKVKRDDTRTLSTREKLLSLSSGRRGISTFERASFVETTPLLVSQTLVFDYDEMTPFQQRSIEIARWYNEEHLERMKLEASAGEEGGIEASPFTAVVDSVSANMVEHADRSPPRRYATLAAIEFIGGGKVQLTGVGRVLLHSYFSSSDAGLSRDEQELNSLLTRIQEIDRKASLDSEQVSEDDGTKTNEEDERDESDREPAVIMAEFEVLLDNSSIVAVKDTSKYSDVSQHRSSAMHAITRLYQSANRVYRLHEERKKLVAGLRAGEARLKLGRARKEGECILFDDFDDYDGLGLHSSFSVDELAEVEQCVQYSELDTAEDNFGFSYGFLSTFPDLTNEVMSLLEPFYSPHHREREEFVAEVASFVALRTLEDYASPTELATALLTVSAKERLDMSYEIMLRHKDELSALTRTMSKDLIDCGEECTDLW